MRRLPYLEVAEVLTGLSKGQENQAKDPASLIQPPLKPMPVEALVPGASRNLHILQRMPKRRP